MERYGIATSGNWIVDRVEMINLWPPEETLAHIRSEQRGTGGGAYNCIVDLKNLGAEMPLMGIGCIGDDADGQWIRDDLATRGIDHRWIRTCGGQITSYTDVMTVELTGRRTFFHHVGANANLSPQHFPYDELPARVAHLAYLLVLPGLDQPDPEFGSVGAQVLAQLRQRGILTCLDVISEDSPRVREIVVPALAHTDCLVINEFEAGVISGIPTRSDGSGGDLLPDAVRAAARKLLELGVQQQVVLHMPEGGYVAARDGQEWFQPSLALPEGFIAGAAGAGDAFAAGVLYGLHEGWEVPRTLQLAVATAAACLRHPTTTLGVGSLAETLGLLEQHPLRAAVL